MGNMKGVNAILLCFLSSITVGVARLGTTYNRSLEGENRSLFDEFEYDRSLFNRSLEHDGMYFNRSLFNRSLESRRLMEEPIAGMFNRTLQANRTLFANRSLEADEYFFSGYNRSLEYEYYNRSLFNRSLESRRLMEEPIAGMFNRTLQENRTLFANRSLEADEYLFSGHNRSLEYEYYNRSLYNRTF